MVSSTGPARAATWLDDLQSDGEMVRLVRTHDWASTPLGPLDDWPLGLCTAVRIALATRFPMAVFWGPDLLGIYNDGFSHILGEEKHPSALGRPAREVWAEIWDEIGPRFAEVVTQGVATWDEHQPLTLHRNGYPEECYFTWSYSALHDDDGTVAGILDVVTESTHEVVVQRRLGTVSMLSAALIETEKLTEVCRLAVSSLTRSADVVAADMYLRLGDGVTLMASNRVDAVSEVDPDLVLEVGLGGVPVVVGGGADDGSCPAERIIRRVATRAGGPEGVLVADLSPNRPFDLEYRSFIDLVAATIGAALDNAYRRAVAVDEYRSISETLQQAMLRPASDLPTVAARYLPVGGGLSVGGDWYDVIELDDHRRVLVVGDCVGHGIEAATVMGQMRSATRAMLIGGSDPAEALEGLDHFAATTEHAFAATLVCAVVDRLAHTLTYARAGHPPPLLVGVDGSRWLDADGGPPLAVDLSRPRTSTTVPLRVDDLVILFSDGLVERRDESIDVGLERLRAAANDLFGRPVNEIADQLLRRTLGSERFDDVVLVVKQLGA